MNKPMNNSCEERETVKASELQSVRASERGCATLPTLLRSTLLALTVTLAALPLVSCKKSGPNAKPADVDYYTCTMHPSVKAQDPNAKCPICSMDLVPVKKKGAPAEHDHGQQK